MIRILLGLIVLLIALVPGVPHAVNAATIEPICDNTTWDIQTVDSIGDVGECSSLALDIHGYPHISYVDITNGNLKYAHWHGSAWDIQTVDSDGIVGMYNSIALDSDGNPHISYCDDTNWKLKYARWNGSAWTISTVGTEGEHGNWNSIAIDSQDNPHIVFSAGSDSRGDASLKYARWNGSSWVITTVDAAGYIANHNSIALDYNDYPHISYNNYSPPALKYAHWNGSAWDISTVDTEGAGAPDNSIAVDKCGNPHISYYDGLGSNMDLKYAHWNGSAWDIQTVDSDGIVAPYPPLEMVGMYNSIALDSDGNPHISYYSEYYSAGNHKLKYARWNGSTWCIETVLSSAGTMYRDTSLALDAYDLPHISYEDDSSFTKDLAYASGHRSSQQVNTATGTGIATFNTSNGDIVGLKAAATTPCGTLADFDFPHGFFSFTIGNLSPGSTVTITITLPSNMPTNTQYWKCINGQWVDVTSILGNNDGDNILTLTITDGGQFDADGQVNGTIVDPGGLAVPQAAIVPAAPQERWQMN